MDLLEASKEAIEKALYFRLADLLNLDVELIFYDTTSVHFESDEEDEGSGEGDEVGGSVCSGAKTYRAPRKRGKSKDGRDDAPQIVVGLAVTRDGFPVRHWVFPGNTVDVTTVAKVQAELKDWRLGRCVFVGDAGMVSEKNLKALSASGGRYIVCMPIHLGGEVDQAVLSRPGRYQEVAENLRVNAPIASACSPRSKRSSRASVITRAKRTASVCARYGRAAAMGATSSSPPPASPSSTRPKSRPPSAWTASSSCTATTTPSACSPSYSSAWPSTPARHLA